MHSNAKSRMSRTRRCSNGTEAMHVVFIRGEANSSSDVIYIMPLFSFLFSIEFLFSQGSKRHHEGSMMIRKAVVLFPN